MQREQREGAGRAGRAQREREREREEESAGGREREREKGESHSIKGRLAINPFNLGASEAYSLPVQCRYQPVLTYLFAGVENELAIRC